MGKAKQKHHSPKARTSNIKSVAYSGENQFSSRQLHHLGIPITKSWVAPTNSSNASKPKRISKQKQKYIDEVMNVNLEPRVNPVKLTKKRKKIRVKKPRSNEPNIDLLNHPLILRGGHFESNRRKH